jgi:ferrous iron transport protein B
MKTLNSSVLKVPQQNDPHTANCFRVCLVGNPNCGKTTLINALTGSQLRVGNWPGVTVERKSGLFSQDGNSIEVIDLPGTYTLVSSQQQDAVDEQIAREVINAGNVDLFINVIDANNLERNLYLTAQLLEREQNVIVVLTMMDLAKSRRIQIDVTQLSQQLGCPVIAIEANRGKGITELKQAMLLACEQQTTRAHSAFAWPSEIKQAVQDLAAALQQYFSPRECRSLALRLLENDMLLVSQCDEKLQLQAKQSQTQIKSILHDDVEVIMTEARYQFARKITEAVTKISAHSSQSLTTILDKITLNRFFGIPIFLAVVYLMFLFAINIGGVFQDFFDIGSSTLFVEGLAQGLTALHLPAWLIALLASGVGKGINTTLTFIPVIGGMFFFLSLLESSGYMTRAAFVMDRFMRAMGLPGKAFVPLIVGFGCNVPAIMATRTLQSQRDRILTIIMSPFMSCSARLAIYAIFVAAFFPVGGQNVVFVLYCLGIIMAVLSGLVLRKTLLSGEATPFILEMPPYHLPTLRVVLQQTWLRLQRFLFKAGKYIIPVCVLMGLLNSLTVTGQFITQPDQHSLLSMLGRVLTPLFAPMGLQQSNWPATVGLLTGTLAKEVVVATLNSLYTQAGHLTPMLQQHTNILLGLKAALYSIPQNILALPGALGNPVLASAKQQSVTAGVYGVMYKQFHGQVGAFAYLLFVLLYVPCVSTVAAVAKELNKKWALFSVCWSTGLAYAVAVLFYQIATWQQHAMATVSWVVGLMLLFVVTTIGLKLAARNLSTINNSLTPSFKHSCATRCVKCGSCSTSVTANKF